MKPGPNIIRECSACGKLIAQPSYMSANTFGARYWSDGLREAPMCPAHLDLVKCPNCDALVWIVEQKVVQDCLPPWLLLSRWHGKIQKDPPMQNFENVLLGYTPSLQDYVHLLDAGLSDKSKERYVRLQIWWKGNDQRRGSSRSIPLDSQETDNLRVLATLLVETDDSDRLMKAEVLRELGEFADAEKLLSTEFDGKLKQAVSIIRDLNQKRFSGVAEMIFR